MAIFHHNPHTLGRSNLPDNFLKKLFRSLGYDSALTVSFNASGHACISGLPDQRSFNNICPFSSESPTSPRNRLPYMKDQPSKRCPVIPFLSNVHSQSNSSICAVWASRVLSSKEVFP